MNDTQRGILLLLKSALTGQPEQLPESFSLEEAYPLIKAHQLIPIAYDGAVRCGLSRKDPIMRQMLSGTLQCTLVSEGQSAVLEQLFSAFESAGIDYMPVKGFVLKTMFPSPEMRMMGDADVLIRMEQYGRIKPILAGLGMQKHSESDHELVWHCDRLHLELHKRLIPPVHRDFCAYFGDGWSLAQRSSGSRFRMSPEDEFAYLFTHYAKHYRSGGIGCRHILDLWVYRNAHPDLDEKRVRGIMKKIHLLEFYDNTADLIRFWFDGGPGSDKLGFMTQFIFNSGSWGKIDIKTLAIYVQSERITGSSFAARARVVLLTLFPTLAHMQHSYPILKKAPFLTPLFWPIRWVTILLFRRDKIRLKGESMKAASSDRIDAYRRSLEYVGLDFHYDE